MYNKPRKAQQGFAVMLVVFLVLLATTAYLAHALNSNMVNIERDKQTAMALTEAKAALIGWSAANNTMPGTLPCPDANNTGSESIVGQTCVTNIGHLPWQTLGLADIRDGSGECLWYALTPIYSDAIPATSRDSTNKINSTIPGTITIKNADGITSSPANPVIAVIFSPGFALAGQDRSNVGNTTCGGNINPANYLDSAQGINNSTGNVAGNIYTFIAGTPSSTFNDRFIYITAQELYQTVRKRMVKEILGNVVPHAGPVDYYDNNPGTYPPSLAGLQYTALGNWLTNNDWFSLASYAYTSPNLPVTVAVTDALGSYSCKATANTFTCTSP